jgi:DNA-binding NarL/FixJ family response regulator
MDILIWSTSAAFNRHVASALDGVKSFDFVATPAEVISRIGTGTTLLIHSSSVGEAIGDVVPTAPAETVVAVAADIPDVRHMLTLMQWNIRGYFNSFMAPVHYRHMLQLLKTGQSWYAPDMLQAVIQLARANLQPTAEQATSFASLSARERQIASAVANGMSNKQIANHYGISERTVKTHLTHIFEKLGINNRVALATRAAQSSELLRDPA